MVVLLLLMTILSPATAPEPGVPLTLAQARVHQIAALRYALEFSVPASVGEPVTGRAIIRFTLGHASAPVTLDFAPPTANVRKITAGGQEIPVAWSNGHLVVDTAHLRGGNGENEIAIDFVAGNAPLNRNPDFLYSIFVPARAHHAFPCFDQPDLKGRYTLTLEVPEGWEALANGAETSRTAHEGRVRIAFAETQPIPTYLFAFGAGRFSVEIAERNGRTYRMLHRETDAAKVSRNRDAIFDLHASALEWLERYTGIPYQFGKFDFLLVPAFQFGGMEHPGAIFYNAPALLLDPSATQNQKLGRASLIAHETAHMWFGDLVTMRWFNDVWMKEVFANFMAAKIVNPSFPEIDHELRFLLAHHPAAYDVDRTAGTNAIRQELDNLSEAGTLYGAIIYQKAPVVMRQLEMMLGADVLREGLREYLRAHAFANATWTDLIRLLDGRTQQDLAAWSRAWVEEEGRPVVTTELRLRDGRIASLAFVQSDPLRRSTGLTWTQQIRVLVGTRDGEHVLPVTLAGSRTEVKEAARLATPLFVLPTAGGIGYADFRLDPATIEYLLARLPELPDGLTRGSAWVTLWEQMLDGRIPAAAMFDLALAALPREHDELNVQRILSYAQQLYWKFLTAAERARLGATLERTLRAGLDSAGTSSVKAAWFTTLRDVALTRPTLEWLERVWRGAEQIPGLTLAEPDYIALAMELAVREVPGWTEILDTQRDRIQNPDRKARFEFVRPALSPDRSVRDRFFESLRDVANRRHEPWVLEAVSYLHHPLRAAASEQYIRPSLDLVREIQRTGDIFFPKRWMDATLAGHSSASAARVVMAFMAGLPPDYPDRLRRVVLSSADTLFRASRAESAATGAIRR